VGRRRLALGILKTEKGWRIVISQRDIEGVAPTWSEIDIEFTERLGMARLNATANFGGYTARAYARGRFAVFDVRPPNCVQDALGVVVPIDVIPRLLGSRDARFVASLTR
jgi:hypothetical protein